MNTEPIRQNHSVSNLVYHLVFCTKYRKAELTDAITTDLFKQAVAQLPITIHECNVGERNHLHILFQAPTHIAPAQVAQRIKGASSRLIKQLIPTFGGWSRGFYISTVGHADVEVVEAYIRSQSQ